MVTPALKIGGEEQRQFGILLQPVEQFGSLIGLTAIEKWRLPRHRHGKRADVIFAHGVAQLQILGTVYIEKLRPHPDHEKLADLFFQRQLLEGLLCPFFAAMIEIDGTRVLILLFGQAGHAGRHQQEEDSQISNHERTIARR